jgi:hypothetical protein
MNLQEIITSLELKAFTNALDYAKITPSCGYASDLLSCVMAGATNASIWVTLQAHSNIVAVASLLEIAAIIITEGAIPDVETIAKANEEGIVLLSSEKSTFYIAGRLWELGLRCKPVS